MFGKLHICSTYFTHTHTHTGMYSHTRWYVFTHIHAWLHTYISDSGFLSRGAFAPLGFPAALENFVFHVNVLENYDPITILSTLLAFLVHTPIITVSSVKTEHTKMLD